MIVYLQVYLLALAVMFCVTMTRFAHAGQPVTWRALAHVAGWSLLFATPLNAALIVAALQFLGAPGI